MAFDPELKNEVKKASSFSQVREIFMEGNAAGLRLVSSSNWPYLHEAVEIFGYQNEEFDVFLEDVNSLGPVVFLEHATKKLNPRCHTRLLLLLHTLVKLGLLEASAPPRLLLDVLLPSGTPAPVRDF